MKKKEIHATIALTLVLAFLLITMFSGCGSQNDTAETDEPVVTADPATITPASTDEPAEPPETESDTAREDGERFETVIMLEGMEETVHYEHIRNDTIGFEMDYDYELFARHSEPDRERFVLIYDDPENPPENYLEITYSPEDAGTIADTVSQTLSNEYEITRESYTLDRMGDCIRIDASIVKGATRTADLMQMVYIIPAADGSRIAAAHYVGVDSDGLIKRFSYLVNTLMVIDRQREKSGVTEEMAYEGVSNYCHDTYNWSIAEENPSTMYIAMGEESETEYQVIFRSYTGAFVYFYVDKSDGTVRMTEYVPMLDIENEAGSISLYDYLTKRD